jgi:hypothetical protein
MVLFDISSVVLQIEVGEECDLQEARGTDKCSTGDDGHGYVFGGVE